MDLFRLVRQQQYRLSVLSLLMLIWLSCPGKIQAISLSNLEQQINISNGEFSTSSTNDSPTDNSLGLVHFDSNDYTGDEVYFEAVIRCVACVGGNQRVLASLYNIAGVSQASVYTSNSTYTIVRTPLITIGTGDYTVRFKVDAGTGTAYLKAARLIVDQNALSLTNTLAQIELGHYENTLSTSATSLSAPKYYIYNGSKYTGNITAYFEATLKTSNNLSTITYDFNGTDSGGQEWANFPASMADSSAATFASTSLDQDIQLLNSNQSTGNNLGTITKVEIRAYSYQLNDTTGSITLRPIFGGNNNGNNHNHNPATVAGWSNYQEITTDTNSPTNWTWTDVQNLDIGVIWNTNGGSNTGYVAMVDVRITYENSNVTANALLFNRSDNTAVGNSTVSTSSNNYQLVRSAALTTNFDSLDQYEVRFYTNNNSNTAYIANAKLVLNQTEADGINRTETIQHYLTTLRTQNSTIYTSESFINKFDPANFSGTNNLEAFFEANMYTTALTGYAKLYNISDSDQIDDATSSELSVTSPSLTRVISSNLVNNTDWPTNAKNFDTILRASADQTTYITNSWLVIQLGAIDPSFSFSVSGVSQGETHNGVTTNIPTTISTIPFGHLSINTPVFASHQLSVDVNEANTSYSVDVFLQSQLQGQYPTNNIDAFAGNGATWTIPQSWTTPTGTTNNVNSGWIGANTSDTDVAGWVSGSNLFGPISTTPVEVMRSNTGDDETVYVTYGIEVNAAQPADSYSGVLIYNVLPKY